MKNTFNQCFDKLKEPYRICIFIVIVLPGIILMNDKNPRFILLGAIYLAFLFYLRWPSRKHTNKQSN